MKRNTMPGHHIVKSAISLGAVTLIILHLCKPALKVDGVTIALVIVASLPWLYSVVESAKLPGGYEIKFRDISKAGEKVGAGEKAILSDIAASEDTTSLSTLERVQSLDPNLAVAGLRIEIEKAVRRIADVHSIPSGGALTSLVVNLGSKAIIPLTMVDGLKTLIRIGNEAVHGASVDPEAANWAILHSEQIIRSLNSIGGDLA